MRYIALLLALIVSMFVASKSCDAQTRQIYLETRFLNVDDSNVSDFGVDPGEYASVSQFLNVQSGSGQVVAQQSAQILNPVGSGNGSQVEVSFFNDVGEVPFLYTGGATGTSAQASLFFVLLSPVNGAASSRLDVEVLILESVAGFNSPIFDARDVNNQQVVGVLNADSSNPDRLLGSASWDSNPNFDPTQIVSMGVRFQLTSGSDAFVTFDSIQFSGVPEPGMFPLMMIGFLGVAVGRRRKSV